jgi:hypothetical protein
MTHTRSPALVARLLALGMSIAPAHAQLSRTFVSAAIGNDANNCDRPTPCRTFQTAHDKTNSDGEISVLDTGGYGGLTIGKSISIVNDGVGEASILVSGGGTGVTINAPPAAYVHLRGLTIQGIGFGGGQGLVFTSGFSLTMENCVVRNHTGDGIRFSPGGPAPQSHLAVSNTLVADNGGSGLNVAPTGNFTTKAVITRVEAYHNSNQGIAVDGQGSTGIARATVADSVAGNNGGVGFLAHTAGSGSVTVMVVRSIAANNSNGIVASGTNAVLRFSQSTVSGNVTSTAAVNLAVLRSYGDNNIDGNGDGDPAPTTIVKK